ncbi:MAG TPA: dihydroorotase, partial [Burkholderiales bacterium]|nr:dihydroorotase [Burkholderiales bacterium]
MELLIKNGRVVDPATRTDDTLDVLVADGRIAAVGPRLEAPAARTIDASRLVVVPGLIDMHTHLREPGFEAKETIASGTRAAARGGFTAVCPMPNTNPVNDSPGVTRDILAEAARTSPVNVFPIAAVTKGSNGEELADMASLVEAGAVAFSDDGRPVSDSRLMRRALEAARSLGILIIDHCEDRGLSCDGVMHEGPVSRRLELRGIPGSAEEVMVARDLILARELGARVHIAHVSMRGAALALRAAKEDGVAASGEATPHHLLLTDEDVDGRDANFKMNPPLRSRKDAAALTEAVASGVIDAIATDHAPHTAEEKARGFEKAPFGIVGLETAVPLILDRLVQKKIISLGRFVELLAANPARLLGLRRKGRIAPGA